MSDTTKTTISFNDLPAGTLITDQFADQGVTVTSSAANPAMIFDAAQDPDGPVSGGDTDLLNESAGGILIASENGDSSDPDDAGGGATIGFSFDQQVVLQGITLADVDQGATITVRDAAGRLLFEQEFVSDDGEYLEIEFDVPGAVEMQVAFAGSGGLDDLVFTKAIEPDGIVNGTTGDDLIDADYVDADGDVIDGGDAIGVKGTTGDDDFVTASDGNDTVFAGEGNDLVRGEHGDDLLYGEAGMDTLTGGLGNDTAFGGDGMDEILTFRGDDSARGDDGDDWMWAGDGDDTHSGDAGDDMLSGDGGDDLLYGGSGDDTVDGGDGNDTIFGDSDPDTAAKQGDPICGDRESFNWAEVDGFAKGAAAGGATQNTGTVDVTFSVLEFSGDVTDRYETFEQNTSGIDSDPETADDDASFSSILRGDESSATYGFAFSSLIKNVSFNVNDIDADSVVTILAFDADGGEVPVTLTGGSKLKIDGATADSLGGRAPDASDDYGVTVSIEGVVSRIEIVHEVDGDATSGVNVTDLFFDPVTGFEGGAPADGGDDKLIGGDGDDSIEGEGGNDTIHAGDGGDTVDGGAGDDSIKGGDGDDVLRGGGGNDTVQGEAGDDSVSGSANDDLLSGGTGDDTISGSGGDDTASGGSGDDDIRGGKGDDEVSGGEGSDRISGGAGNDTIDSGIVGRPDLGYPGLFPADDDPTNDLDTVDGGDGDDVIRTGDDADLVTGGTGNDTIDGGFDRDTISGDDGDDFIVGGDGSDVIDGGDGADTIYGGLDPKFPDELNIVDVDADGKTKDLVQDNGRDLIDGGDGDDLIFGQDDDDTIFGGDGDDTIDGGIDEDSINGGDGDDVITGGQGGDTVTGGAGADMIDTGADRDVIIGATSGDMIDGGEAGDDFDTLDLTGSGVAKIDYTSDDREDGIITFDDDSTAKFEEIENVIPCFTPGTLIATPRGEVPVEGLAVGDRVITRDNGIQTIRWIGRRVMSLAEMVATEAYRPVMIRQGALGHGLPERDMMVSPQHRVLIVGDETLLYFEEREVLVAAMHLVGRPGIERMTPRDVSYIHVMFDSHQVILSDGAWTESFQPGDASLAGLADDQRTELLGLFPELRDRAGRNGYVAARRSLKRREAELLSR